MPKQKEPILVDEQTVIEGLLHRIPSVIDAKPAEPFTPKRGRPTKEAEQFVLLLSDIHVGRKTQSYNTSVMWKRADILLNAVSDILNIHRTAHPVEVINVMWLGDIIQHERIGRTVELSSLELTVMEQIYQHGLPLMEYIIDGLLAMNLQVRNYCVAGNHGRYGKRESDPTTNWDTVLYHSARLRYENNKRVTWKIATKGWYLITNIGGIKWFLWHGDQVRMYQTTPIYGLNTRVLRLQDSIEADIDVFACGHFHSSHYWQNARTAVIINGTWVSDDDWVLKTMGLVSSTRQWLLGIHKGKISFMSELYLDRGAMTHRKRGEV